MIFNSIDFLLKFLPIFIFLYLITPNKFKNVTLIVGSFLFYASCGLGNLLLLSVMILFDYGMGRWIGAIDQLHRENGKKRKKTAVLLFAAVVAANLSVLFWYKRAPGEVLPVGLSFYIFQSISYLTDVYRREIPAETSFTRYAAYISMFPHLTSGPVVYYREVEPDLRQHRRSMQLADEGIKQFVVGLACKVLLADQAALLWNDIQVRGFISISTPLAWLGAYAYSMQLYFDFLGYSLMAVGLGKMLGFRLPDNFNLPYAATCIRDFYRRWHITLGRWFSRYVYIPLGGNRKGLARTLLHLLIVWFLTAFWHGSSMNYLIWGMTLWFFISVEKIVDTVRKRRQRNRDNGRDGIPGAALHAAGEKGIVRRVLADCLSHLYVWLVIPVTWVCFAIEELDQLKIYLGRMTGMTDGVNVNPSDFLSAVQDYGILLAVCAFACTPWAKKLYEKRKDGIIGMAVLAVLFWLCVYRILLEGNNPFMYRHF